MIKEREPKKPKVVWDGIRSAERARDLYRSRPGVSQLHSLCSPLCIKSRNPFLKAMTDLANLSNKTSSFIQRCPTQHTPKATR
jgi:hypothetical protein